MELDSRERPLLEGRDDQPAVLDLRRNRIGRRAVDGVAVREVDVLSVEAVQQLRPTGHSERVPAHMRHPTGLKTADSRRNELEPPTALVALAAQELHADADAEDGLPLARALANRLVEPVAGKTARGALDVAD